MRLHQVTHHREPDAAATFGPRIQRVGLGEQLEHPCKHRWRDADARVAKADAGMPADALHGECDVTAVGCVLGGVDQQVREHLLEASDVRVHPKRIGRQTNHQAMAMARHLRRNRVDRELYDCAQVRVCHLQRLLVPGVRCIQQFLDMPRHLADMAFDEHARSINAIFTDGKSQQSRRIAHYTERIAQLVRDRGDLIGARIGDAQRQHNAGQTWRVKRVVR